MYKLSRRKNLVPFLVLIISGLVATAFLPQMFPESVFEIPAFALFAAEMALVMMLSVFFFENATPAELIKLAFSMLGFCMLAGAICNVTCSTSQKLPDETLLLNWVQLICMNITGLVGTIALYQTKAPSLEQAQQSATRQITVKEAAKTMELPPGEVAAGVTAANTAAQSVSSEKIEIATGESAKEILSKLEGRFNEIEQQRQAAAATNNQSLSLESLFADESQAAQATPISKEAEGTKANSLDDLLGGDDLDTPAAKFDDGFSLDSIPTAAVPPEPVAAATPVVTEPPLVIDDSAVDIGLGFDDLDMLSSEPAPPEPKAPEPTPAPAENKATLFDDVSSDLDDIFSNLAPDAPQDFDSSKLADIKATSTEPAPKAESKLFDDVGNDLDDIFKSLAPEAAHKEVGDMLDLVSTKDVAPTPAPAPSPPPASTTSGAPREVKEFGRLSGAATAKTELATPGTLKTIGQMLLDTHAIENIIKRSEGKDSAPAAPSAATAKVVSVSRGADIQNMLNKICSYPGVDGSLVIGKDGLLIGATDSLGMMRDVLGVLALGIHSTTNLGTKKSDMGELRQSVMRTGQKLTVLTEIGIGVLATFSDTWNLSALDGMLEHIGRVVTDSQASGGTALPMESLSGGLLAAETTPPPPPPPPSPPPQAEANINMAEAKGGLLNVTDADMGDLFDNVLADPGKQNDSSKSNAAAASATGKPLMSVNDDDMTDLFDNLLDKSESAAQLSMDFSPEAAAPAAAAEPAVEAKAEDAKKAEGAKGQQIKEFGRLSASSASHQSASDGAIKAIGRQLIDVQAVENIIKSGEKREKMGAGLTTARVISAARGEGIRALLTKIDGCPGVMGSLIVGNDGLVIASTLQGGLDKDLLGALCTAMHSHTDLAARKLQMGKLRQIIFHASDRMTILTAVAVGVLAVFVENHDMTQIDSLLTAIEGTVRG